MDAQDPNVHANVRKCARSDLAATKPVVVALAGFATNVVLQCKCIARRWGRGDGGASGSSIIQQRHALRRGEPAVDICRRKGLPQRKSRADLSRTGSVDSNRGIVSSWFRPQGQGTAAASMLALAGAAMDGCRKKCRSADAVVAGIPERRSGDSPPYRCCRPFGISRPPLTGPATTDPRTPVGPCCRQRASPRRPRTRRGRRRPGHHLHHHHHH